MKKNYGDMLDPTPTMREMAMAAKWVCETAGDGASDDTLSLATLIAGLRMEACERALAAERERSLAVLDEMAGAAEKRRPGHYATPWLKHARDALASGIDPRAEPRCADGTLIVEANDVGNYTP